MRKTKKIFSMIEYALLFSLIVAALLMIRIYIQRGLMYKYKETGDSIGNARLYDGKLNLEGI